MKLPTKEHIIVPLLVGLALVLLHLINIKNFSHGCMGIQPYTFSGLKGVLMAPLIHWDSTHLIGNLFPLMALIFLSFQFYGKITYWVMILGWFAVGLMVWAFPSLDPNYSITCHIGASGVVYVFAFFLVFGGIFNKKKALINLTLLIVVGFGSMFWGIFPEELLGMQDSNISWQSHLSGAIVGIVLSYLFKSKDLVEDKKFDWEGSSTLSEHDQELWNRYLEIIKEQEEERIKEENEAFLRNFYHEDRKNST